jgi:hypothetical protein
MYEIRYNTPRGSLKWVLWRGKSGPHACRSWLEIAAEGTTIVDYKPKVMKWFQ